MTDGPPPNNDVLCDVVFNYLKLSEAERQRGARLLLERGRVVIGNELQLVAKDKSGWLR